MCETLPLAHGSLEFSRQFQKVMKILLSTIKYDKMKKFKFSDSELKCKRRDSTSKEASLFYRALEIPGNLE